MIVRARLLERFALGAPAVAALHSAHAVVLGDAAEGLNERRHRRTKPRRRHEYEEDDQPRQGELRHTPHVYGLDPTRLIGKLLGQTERDRRCVRRGLALAIAKGP